MAATRGGRPAPLRARGSYQASKPDLVRRLHRVNGQVAGIAQMVEEERYCPEVLIQLSSAIAALQKVGFLLLRGHVRNCVVEAVGAGEGDASMDELMATIHRFTGR